MRVISVNCRRRAAPLALCLALATGGAGAQEDGSGPVAGDESEELAPITLEDSRHVSDPVFDEEITEALPDTAPQPQSSRERLRQLFTLYRDAVADSMYAEADTLAKQIVELTIEINGLDSSETARAITNLAIAQHGADDYESAELNFQSAIEITERISDRLNEDLINPLKGLAAAQLALGKPVQAADTYQRATHISHVNYGPHNLEQIEMLESLAETFLSAGEFDEAVDIQQRIYALQTRNIEADSEEMLPALYTQARWQHRLQLYDKERYTLRRIISVLEDSRGDDDLSLIRPLTALGNSYLFVGSPEISYHQPTSNSTGEIYLKRALRLAEDHPEATWQIKAETMLALADYYILTDKPSRAERVYSDVWDLLSDGDDRVRSRQDQLQTLKVLHDAQPPRFYGLGGNQTPLPRRPDGFETGRIVFEYSLTERGKATDIELVDSNPTGLDDMERSVARELRRIVQRPRVVDGETVRTDKLTYTHNYYYRPGDLPEATTAAGGTPR